MSFLYFEKDSSVIVKDSSVFKVTFGKKTNFDHRIVGNFRQKNRNVIVGSSVTFGKTRASDRRIVGK